MPQLIKAATYQGDWDKFLRCPYQAKVMNKLEAMSISTVSKSGCDVKPIFAPG
jgi:hypothetical protein